MTEKGWTLKEIAQKVQCEFRGDPALRLRALAPLQSARADEISFLANPRYKGLVASTCAGALIVPPQLAELERPVIITENPYFTMARVAQLFASPPPMEEGIHPSAVVAQGATIGKGAAIGPLVHVGDGTRVGEGSRIYGGAYLGRSVTVGRECLIYPGVRILDGCVLGNRVIIHSGTVIGSDGFGFAQDAQGHHVKIPQTGRVRIDDDVEIGANCTVDRATFGETWIQEGVKIDNLVQIAHNVVVGAHAIIVAQVGIAGSTKLGRHVVLGGQVGVGGHLEIADGVRVGAKAAIAHSVRRKEDLLGQPAIPHREWFRQYANLQRIGRMRQEIREMKARIERLEKLLPCEP